MWDLEGLASLITDVRRTTSEEKRAGSLAPRGCREEAELEGVEPCLAWGHGGWSVFSRKLGSMSSER